MTGARAWLAIVLALAACEGTIGTKPPDDAAPSDAVLDAGADTDAAAADAAPQPDAPPVFVCDLPAATPTLAPAHWLHPSAPRAGQTLTVIFQSTNTKGNDAPLLVGEVTNQDGTRALPDPTIAGGDQAIYYFAVGDLTSGENCVVLRRDGNVELALKAMAADAGSGVARGSGPWRVTANHQWRCDEQPTFGNLLFVEVKDETGAPVNGASVSLDVTDDTAYPMGPDNAPSWEASHQPKTLTTGADGRAELWVDWGDPMGLREGILSPVDARPAFVVYLLSIEGGASDTATEITTGQWEANREGCNYCGLYGINVYGHWSHTVTFQRDPAAAEVCDVPVDHAGQQACAFTHFYHDPDRPSCLPVAP